MDIPVLARVPFAVLCAAGALVLLRAGYLASERFFYAYAQLDRSIRVRLAFASSCQFSAGAFLGFLPFVLLMVERIDQVLSTALCLGASILIILPIAFLGTLWRGYSSSLLFGGLMRSIARSQGLPPETAVHVRLNPVVGRRRLVLRLVMSSFFALTVAGMLYGLPLALNAEHANPLLLGGALLVAIILGVFVPETVEWLQRRSDLYQDPPQPKNESRDQQQPSQGA